MKSKDSKETAPVDSVDTSYLESLMGYNVRRASLVIIAQFMEKMNAYALRPTDFSVLALIGDNPGITSRQLCATLNILPPNLVGLINSLEKRGLVQRQPHPADGRAFGLHLTESGQALAQETQRTITAMEDAATPTLTAKQRKTLMHLLQKIYLPH